MKVFEKILITFSVVAATANLPILNKQLLYKIDQNHFRYSNLDASLTIEESFSFKDPYISNWSIQWFIKDTKPATENRVVYRLYKINPFCFWRWSYYLFTSIDYPYKDWKEIEKKRVPYAQGNVYQDF